MSSSATVVIALFIGFIVVYMGLRAYGAFAPTIEFTILRYNNMEFQQSVPGIIIRHEHVFQADRDGRVFFTVNDDVRVSPGERIASIQDVESVTRTEHEMTLLQHEILTVATMRHAAPNPQIERLNASLRNTMDRNMAIHMQSNLSNIYTLLESITQITENRNNTIIEETVRSRNDLTRQNDILAAQHAMNLSYIYSPQGGIMTRIIDGYENAFIPRNRAYVSREEVTRNITMETVVPGREVTAGDDIFKIVENTWYVAVWMPSSMAAGLFSVNANRVIYLENAVTGRFEPVQMRVDYVNETHRDTFVIFRSTRNVAAFLHQRNVNVRITDSVQSGIMVPASAIVTRRFFRVPLTHVHGIENYFIQHRVDTMLHQVPINVYRRNDADTHAYVLEDAFPLGIGSILSPVDPEDMLHVISDEDVQFVHGVYRANLNYASFREVFVDGDVIEEGVPILLNPARNPNIRLFDTIVVDAAMVREGQVLR